MRIELVTRKAGQVELRALRRDVQVERPAIWRAWWRYSGIEAVATVPDRPDLVRDLLAAGHDLDLAGYRSDAPAMAVWQQGELFA